MSDLDGSQISEAIVERWCFARVSQRNVVVLEFGSPCLPRETSLIHLVMNRQRIFQFFHEVFRFQR